ncbi:copper-binding protein [Paraburkholderia humisilvae]|uniref:Uncharacterized protein n=1 Tax=Paraburkholderia humisilvae TaxID=627669 RepID=A0A6J5DGB1_9BURK|nr:copper-binding protein [Paraburkholderia humisilvae]CAB3751916.1 hypothetical protein LMG29542_01596 [Paraburkholderia humisilvae]
MNRLSDLLVVFAFLFAPLAFGFEGMPQETYPSRVPAEIYGQAMSIDRAADLVSIRQVMPKNVGMAPITTTFTATNGTSLSQIHEGDKVKALVESINGHPVVLDISRRPWPIQ